MNETTIIKNYVKQEIITHSSLWWLMLESSAFTKQSKGHTHTHTQRRSHTFECSSDSIGIEIQLIPIRHTIKILICHRQQNAFLLNCKWTFEMHSTYQRAHIDQQFIIHYSHRISNGSVVLCVHIQLLTTIVVNNQTHR